MEEKEKHELYTKINNILELYLCEPADKLTKATIESHIDHVLRSKGLTNYVVDCDIECMDKGHLIVEVLFERTAANPNYHMVFGVDNNYNWAPPAGMNKGKVNIETPSERLDRAMGVVTE